ncbi:hypothetical protein [Aminobacter sp. SR38]|jgi:hypothetical protein|uniref:hypothetical protein n=1 Tax=Aminobacter sp. SR38 TaxID=2774562 RepID=UPI001AEDE959|nr:hypothetical protein [Aminobacter sp. SR38]
MSKTLYHSTAAMLLTEAPFCAWIGQSAPGNLVEYHRGFLAIDTMPACSLLAEADRKELVRLARRAYWAAEKGLVHLVQRRLGQDRFAYLAIAQARPKQLQATLLTLLAQAPEPGALANPNLSLRRFHR